MTRLDCQVVEAAPEGTERVWFASSSFSDGVWYRVTLVPGTALTCSCRAGDFNRIRREMGAPERAPCRHLRAVTAFVAEQAGAVA